MERINVLDHGYVELKRPWGSEEEIIESARMSTDKGFLGWGPMDNCKHCGAHRESENLETSNKCIKPQHDFSGDEKLLTYLWKNKHVSPFEFAGLVLEVQAPIFVIREWQRHRSIAVSEEISFNEMSGRYVELPELYYIPSIERLMNGKQGTTNKQGSTAGFTEYEASIMQGAIKQSIFDSRQVYDDLLAKGLSKELARGVLPINQYSRMRVAANLRGWLAFLELRLPPNVQWETRRYAQIVSDIAQECFPRTHSLFTEALQKP